MTKCVLTKSGSSMPPPPPSLSLSLSLFYLTIYRIYLSHYFSLCISPQSLYSPRCFFLERFLFILVCIHILLCAFKMIHNNGPTVQHSRPSLGLLYFSFYLVFFYNSFHSMKIANVLCISAFTITHNCLNTLDARKEQ